MFAPGLRRECARAGKDFERSGRGDEGHGEVHLFRIRDQQRLLENHVVHGERVARGAFDFTDGREHQHDHSHRRHDRRGRIETMLVEQGLKVARRTRNDILSPDVDVFLGDTIGEMGLYLRLTEVVFVGRSLYAEGGQNPLEPAMLGCAVLSGSNVQNFREAYQRLARRGSARMVRDTEMLAKGVHYLLINDEARRNMIEAGIAAVQEMRGALTATVKALEPYINPLTVKARLLPKSAQG